MQQENTEGREEKVRGEKVQNTNFASFGIL